MIKGAFVFRAACRDGSQYLGDFIVLMRHCTYRDLDEGTLYCGCFEYKRESFVGLLGRDAKLLASAL